MQKRTLIFTISFTLIVLLLAFTPRQTQSSSDLAQQIAAAWEMAQASSRYDYRTQVEQTTYPLPKITNGGAQPREQFIGLEGGVDFSAETLTLTLWPDASFDPNTGIGVRVVEGQTYLRRGQDEWQASDNNITELFAPAGDPMGFLAGIRNVRVGTTQTSDLGTTTHYLFELDGLTFANYTRTRLEKQLSTQGKLPQGVRLSSSEVYKNMIGHGTLWIDEAGLPVRMVLDIEFPAQGEQERVTAVISNDYFGYDTAQLGLAMTRLYQNPLIWLQTRISFDQVVTNLALMLVALTLAYLAAVYWQTVQFYCVIISLVIFSMLFAPLWRGHQMVVHAEEQAVEKEVLDSKREEQRALAEGRAAARLHPTRCHHR